MIGTAKIIDANLYFQDISGNNGRNFTLCLTLQLNIKAICYCDLKFTRLPCFMENLGIDNFKQIVGQYIQVKYEDENQRPNYFRPILADKHEDWSCFDNDIYFGSKVGGVDEYSS